MSGLSLERLEEIRRWADDPNGERIYYIKIARDLLAEVDRLQQRAEKLEAVADELAATLCLYLPQAVTEEGTRAARALDDYRTVRDGEVRS